LTYDVSALHFFFPLAAVDCSVLGFPLNSLRISAHRSNLSTESSEESGIDMKVKKITVHPNFNRFTLDNDVAVWHLEGGDQLNHTVILDDGTYSAPNTNATVIGWGAISEGGYPSDVLLQTQVPVVNQTKCNKELGGTVTDAMICAGGKKGIDACQGGTQNDLFKRRGTCLTYRLRLWWPSHCAI
jgi:secreted trypsin-like serine protease